jgi:hypothetical protein
LLPIELRIRRNERDSPPSFTAGCCDLCACPGESALSVDGLAHGTGLACRLHNRLAEEYIMSNNRTSKRLFLRSETLRTLGTDALDGVNGGTIAAPNFTPALRKILTEINDTVYRQDNKAGQNDTVYRGGSHVVPV